MDHKMDHELHQDKDFEMTLHRVLSTLRAATRPMAWALGLAMAFSSSSALAQSGGLPSGELFAEPFVVEHYMVQIDEFGERYEAPMVVDTYGGSWIVSERVDHSRLVVDLARAEITEIRPLDGTYWTVGFDRMKVLMERVTELEGTRPEIDPALPTGQALTPGKAAQSQRRSAEDWRVEEGRAAADRGTDRARMPAKAASLMSSEGVRHLRLHPVASDSDHFKRGTDKRGTDSSGGATAELWVSPKVKVKSGARAALARFERDALGAEGQMEAAREFVDGAFPIRTIRQEKKSDGSVGHIEDVVIRLEKIESLDRNLVRIPEGLRRVPHPLEGLIAFLERENQRQKMMSGEASSTDTDGYGGGVN